MSRLRELLASVVARLRFARHDAEMDEEIAAHLDLATEEYEARGLDPKSARRAALLDFGGVQQARERHRESRGLPGFESWLQDVRLAVRSLRRDASVSLFAVAIVAVGIGAATLIFSVMNTLLFEPLPFAAPERLVWIANGTSANLSEQTIQVGNLLDLRDASQTFDDVAGFYAFYGPGDLHIDGGGDGDRGPQRITGVPVSSNLFDLLGVRPVVGRGFTEQEVEERAPVLLLSHRLWSSRYAGDRSVVGRVLRLDGVPTTVVGVLPEAFDFERIFTPGRGADVFLPFPLDARNDRRGNTLAVIGRLAPGTTLELAQEELDAIAQRIAERGIERRNAIEPRLVPLHGRVSGSTRPPLLLLSGAVALLLLLVCTNLSNLLLVRAGGRRREMALHLAMGAGRARLLRRTLIESLILSAIGAGLGVVLAALGAQQLRRLQETAIPLLHQVHLDATVLVFSIGAATVVGLLFGVVPAVQASATSPLAALREGARSSGDRGGSVFRRTVVACEVALAFVLLVGLGLFARSLWAALDVDLGFEPEDLVALRVDPPGSRQDARGRESYYAELQRAVQDLPGVERAALTDALPFGDNFGWRTWSTRAAETSAALDDEGEADSVSPLVRIVGPGYAETLGLRLIVGRFFGSTGRRSPADSLGEPGTTEGEREVVINETFARRLWPSVRDPAEVLLRRLVSGGHVYRVIGVVREARYFDLERPSGAEMYLTLEQVPWTNSIDLVIRTRGRPEVHLEEIRRALRAVDPALPLDPFHTMASLIGRTSFDRRAITVLLGAFAGFGLILAALGVYGVIAHSVVQRRRELCVRSALGATRRRLGWSIVGQTLRPLGWGVAGGILLLSFAAPLVAAQLYEVAPWDPLSLCAGLGLVTACSMFAAWIPGQRVARANLAEVLRSDG